MKQLNLVVITVCFLLVLGCNSDQGDRAATHNFKQGVGELGLSFLANSPPDKIYPGSNFRMIIKADNQAAYDLTEGEIKIIGLEEKYFQLGEVEYSFDTLQGRSLYNPQGEHIFIEFSGKAGTLFENAREYIGNYFIKANYISSLEFADTICINPDFYSVYDSGCTVEERRSYSGQGAPLAIVSMEEILYPAGVGAEVEFRLFLQNMGRGTVRSITLGKHHLGGKELSCQFQTDEPNKRFIGLNEEKQEAIIVCKAFVKDQNSYTTTLAVDFSYSYEFKEQQQLRLVNPNYSGGFV